MTTFAKILESTESHPTPASRAYGAACARRERLAQYLARHGDGSARHEQEERDLDAACTAAAEALRREYESTHD